MEDKKVKKLRREAAKKVEYVPKPRPSPESKRLFSLLAKAASRLGTEKPVEKKIEPNEQPVPEDTEIDVEDVSKFYEPDKKGSLPAVFKRVGKILSGEKPSVETEQYKKIEENEAVLIPSVDLKRSMAEKLNDSDIMKTNIVYSLVPRNPSKDDLIFSYANIKWSRDKGKPVYSVAE